MVQRYSFIPLVILLFCVSSVYAETGDDEAFDLQNIATLTFEELLELQVVPVSSLTSVSNKLAPASITTITYKDIESSGARSLDELLEIYVPGFVMMHKTRKLAQTGIRGVISDTNNKLLMIVNGRVMNNHTTVGAFTERFLSVLGDIKQIDVVRGPGSVVYGSGAIGGVISITTFGATSFDGVEVTTRGGGVEEFVAAEMKVGHRINKHSGIFLFGGLDDYRGADQGDTPLKFSNSFDLADGNSVNAQEPVPFQIDDNHRAYRDRIRYKLHGEYQYDEFRIWTRYTRGGEKTEANEKLLTNRGIEDARGMQGGYQQFTVAADYEQKVTESLSFNYLLSFDYDDIELDTGLAEESPDSYREDEYFAKVLSHYTGFEDHKIALGVEYGYEEFGKRSPGYPHQPAHINGRLTEVNGTTTWGDNSYALLFEDQYKATEEIMLFAGLRTDDTRYTNIEFSPRLGVVATPTERDVIKLVYNRATRRPDQADARLEDKSNGEKGDVEKINFYELQYIRQETKNLSVTLSGYYGDYDVVAFTFATVKNQEIGNLDYYGLEAELEYEDSWGQVRFSHNYTKHDDFSLASDSITVQNISASPYGFGDDLANWPDHITKLNTDIRLSDRIWLHSSLRIFWRIPGGEDLADYNDSVVNSNNLPSTDGSGKAWNESVFLNLGLQYDLSPGLTIGTNAYNILGWIDKDFNKRNSYQRTSQYRSEAAAWAIRLKYSFR